MTEEPPAQNATRKNSVAALCRMDADWVDAVAKHQDISMLARTACWIILVGTICYGVAFGAWHSWIQAGYSAVKMPVLVFSTVLASGTINAMLAQVMGSGLTFRQTLVSILLSLAIASAILGALSPAALFLSVQLPAPGSPSAVAAYRGLLWSHTAIIGLCGIAGTTRLYALLVRLTGSRAVSRRVLLGWLLVSGLVGCELSWVISPFLAKPGIPIPFFNPDAFNGNFFEYLWITAWRLP